jgi:hypothetical protein
MSWFRPVASTASSVGWSSRRSLRLAPSVVQPIGMPWPSGATDHVQPQLPRSVGLGPVPSPPGARCRGTTSIPLIAQARSSRSTKSKLYVAGIKDLHDRGLAGWSIDERQTDLVVNAFVMAHGRRFADHQAELAVPRDRLGTFEPATVPKHQRRLDGLSGNVISLYAKGLITGDIQAHLAEMGLRRAEMTAEMVWPTAYRTAQLGETGWDQEDGTELRLQQKGRSEHASARKDTPSFGLAIHRWCDFDDDPPTPYEMPEFTVEEIDEIGDLLAAAEAYAALMVARRRVAKGQRVTIVGTEPLDLDLSDNTGGVAELIAVRDERVIANSNLLAGFSGILTGDDQNHDHRIVAAEYWPLEELAALIYPPDGEVKPIPYGDGTGLGLWFTDPRALVFRSGTVAHVSERTAHLSALDDDLFERHQFVGGGRCCTSRSIRWWRTPPRRGCATVLGGGRVRPCRCR